MADKQKLTSKKRDPTWTAAFIASLSLTGNVTRACESSGVSRWLVYELRNNDPVFAEAWDNALEQATDLLEEEARRRAYSGVDEPVFGSLGQGLGTGEVGTIRKYSDTLLIFLLNGNRPQKYRQTAKTVNINISYDDIQNMSDDELERFIQQHSK